jgi:hypothetical protein
MDAASPRTSRVARDFWKPPRLSSCSLSRSDAMLVDGSDGGGLDMPIVHPCTRSGCETLTMGEFCLEHEQQSEVSLRVRGRRLLPHLATAGALVAAAAVGALIRTRLPR